MLATEGIKDAGLEVLRAAVGLVRDRAEAA
jgi:hypothetical protein